MMTITRDIIETEISKEKYNEKENVILRLFIAKKKLIKKFAEEMAYLQDQSRLVVLCSQWR